MTTGADVDIAELAIGDRIGDGGQGEVFEVRSSSNLLYKRYKNPHKINGAALSRLVALYNNRNVLDRRWLDHHCAWPKCRVLDGNAVVGFVMHRATRAYTWRSADKSKRLLELQYLIRPVKRAWQQVPSPSAAQRRELALRFAELVRKLHSWGVVVGDISHANILWRLGSEPDVYLLDCDGVRLRNAAPVAEQADTTDWDDPHQKTAPTRENDRYKSALVIGRILTNDPYYRPDSSTTFVSGALSAAQDRKVRGLLARAAEPGGRPTLDEWVETLGNHGGPARGSAAWTTPTPSSRTPRKAGTVSRGRDRPTLRLGDLDR